MSLYKDWTDTVVSFVKTNGEAAFWKEYGAIEKHLYTKVLADHSECIDGIIKDLAENFEVQPVYFMGFLDGINDSLKEHLDLENLDDNSSISIKVDFEKLYFNMLDAKADYLYHLPQWDSIFSKEKRREIHKTWAASKTVINKNKIGRNDPCPCGSGKKYKNCCGKN
ncbi:SEC-C metal-binding domain-containing protein [Clostridium sp. JN-1]|jgi:preprotein translocase subunit SecA|uniref:SEC-C metal-binding domain-containing protein n=1 Tax=Clostridium sp. JN-1 TaxID=2483110 RepID=UPI000F0B2FD8|nr:SEC-C metal-binding domain-containing protein [Clostridium sp. JN-1]